MGFGFKKVGTEEAVLGATWTPPYKRKSGALVKSGGGGTGLGQGDSGGGGGGGQEPLGCPKCIPWWFVPLGALGIMQFAAWILARK